MERNKYQKIIANVLGTRPIAFNADLARALGKANAGLFLSQLLFWWEKGSNPSWIYKTIDEIEKETTLSRQEQDTAIRICKEHGVLEVKLMGIPAKRHFRLSILKIIELLESSLLRADKQVCRKLANKIVEKAQTNTENTQRLPTKSILLTEEANQIFAGYFLSNKEKCNAYKQGKRWGEKPHFKSEEMRWSEGKSWWQVIPEEGGQWQEFGAREAEIEWSP